MAKPVTDEERQRIIDAFATGHSCRQIAKQFQRSTTTVSHIARSVGHQFGQINTARARAINRRYGAEWRAETRQKLADEVDRLLSDMRKPMLAYNFGGKDNTYEEHQLDEPDIRGKRDLMQTVATALRSIRDMDAVDNAQQGNRGQLDAWFDQITAAADEYHDPTATSETSLVDQACDRPD